MLQAVEHANVHKSNDQLRGEFDAAGRRFGFGMLYAFTEYLSGPMNEEEEPVGELIDEMRRRKLL